MNIVDFLLNVACLLMWGVWRSMGFSAGAAPVPSLSVLTPAGPPRTYRNGLLLALAVVLLVRAWLYWRVGAAIGWVAALNLGVVSLPFNSASLLRMLIYSFLAFGVFLAVGYLWLILLSIVNKSVPNTDPLQREIRQQLGWMDRWPGLFRLTTPPVLIALLWYVGNPLLAELGMSEATVSSAQLWQQGAVLGIGAFLCWKYLIAAILLLHVLNSYLYLGSHNFWIFISVTARNLLRPISWLPFRVGSVDLTPVAGIALTFLALELAESGLQSLFARLPI